MITKTNKDEFLDYLSDAANIKGEGIALYIPENKAELATLVKEFYRSNTPFTISAMRTSLTGAAVPHGEVIISTEELNRIIEINADEKSITVEAGVLINQIQESLYEKGFFYAPDPTEINSTIGGNIATNASGAKSFKYGATRNHVTELEVILPDGEPIKLIRGKNFAKEYHLELCLKSGEKRNINLPAYDMPHVKNTAGFYVKRGMDAIDLFIGTEGTLGIITEAKVGIIPIPYHVFSAVLFFPKEELGLNFISLAAERSRNSKEQSDPLGINARALEFFDRNALLFAAEDYPNIPPASGCAVWLEQELSAEAEDTVLSGWYSLFMEFNLDIDKIWVATNYMEEKKIASFRHLLPLKVNEYIARNNFRKIGTDVAVERQHFKKFYFEIKDLTIKSNLNFVIYGHFGDSHIHLNMLPRNENEFLVAKSNYDIICKTALKYGGTVSAEHGIGKVKTHLLREMYGEKNIKKMAALKKSIDPLLLLNPGNIIPTEIFESLA
ncbi:MAG: FAD-binding oxidoreductase [Ignavibacteriaceae bacterium]